MATFDSKICILRKINFFLDVSVRVVFVFLRRNVIGCGRKF